MEKMVAGLLFSEAFRYVTLIEKNRPSWQAGLLNGVGGSSTYEDGYVL